MPAEWEPHEATWLGWPHELTDWPGKFAPIPWAFAEIVRHLAQVERVYLLVENRGAESRVRSMLKKSGANLVCRLLLEKKKQTTPISTKPGPDARSCPCCTPSPRAPQPA